LLVKKRSIAIALATLALTAASATTASAFDCIRVSSSLQGLMGSMKSGNWLVFDFSSAAGAKQTFANVGGSVTDQQAQCFVTAYAKTDQPKFFALGVGVAGGKKTSATSNGARAAADGFGVIAWNNGNDVVLSDGHGIDHFDDSPILAAVFTSAMSCGIQLS
jgi:hypothetical protein